MTLQFLTEPEPKRSTPLEILPGVTRLVAPNPGPMTYWGTNSYVLRGAFALPGAAGALVVDPGPDDAAHVAALLTACEGAVAAILLTHTHPDHVGALPALRAATGAPVVAFHSLDDPAVTPDHPLDHHARIGPWQAIHTPGHAPDHLCFLGPEGVLLSGDHVMGWSTTVVGGPGGDMAAYFASLDRMLAAAADRYLPGHGPAIAAPGAYVEALLAHRRAREAAIAAALGAVPVTVRALAELLYPGLDPALRRAAERNVAAHLQKLRCEGRALELGGGWRARGL